MMRKLLFMLLLPFFSACFVYNYAHYKQRKVRSVSEPISHAAWTDLLAQHVDTLGNVDYKGFVADSVALKSYIATLAAHHPNEKNWSKTECVAYWINAYNAYTVYIVCQYYPVKSIKDIERKAINIPFGNTVWDIDFIDIEGEIYSLNYLEHKILRKEFNEPRVHFAVNCASFSCPALRAEAYEADKLEVQLSEQARLFLSDKRKNVIENGEKIQLSKIFSWFGGDFERKPKKGVAGRSLIDFINLYSPLPIAAKADIEYLDYNWGLNEQ